MASGPPPFPVPVAAQNYVKIPFENHKIMDECRLEVLRKHRKVITERVRFSDVSCILIACGLFSKDECFEVCKLPVKRQMSQCFQKVHDIMDILVCQQKTSSQNKGDAGISYKSDSEKRFENIQSGLVKNIWENFLLSLKNEHPQISAKMENDLYKCAESKLVVKRSSKSPTGGSLKLKKEDIGSPKDFQHVKHYGLKCSRSMNLNESQEEREKNSSSTMNTSSLEALDLKDADLKEFFSRAGVQERHLANDYTKEIIIRFIADHGGMDAIRREVRQMKLSSNLHLPSPLEGEAEAGPVQDAQTGKNEKRDEKGVESNIDSVARPQSPPRLFTNQGPPPATVPFEPTPKPVPDVYYYF